MNIKCSELDNFNVSLDYYNSIKLVSDEVVKYIKAYRQILLEYVKKIQNMQSNFKKKLDFTDNPKTSQIISSLTSKIFKLLEQNNDLFQLSFDEIDLRLKEFDSFIKEKNESIKTILKLSQDFNKSLTNSYNDANKAKNNYLSSLAKAEELINKYYTLNNRIKQYERGLNPKLNENEYTTLKEQIKNHLNDMNNSIKVSKKLEISYQDSISSSVKLHEKYVKNYNIFTNKIRKNTVELSDEIKTLIVSFMLSYKNNYKQPLTFVDSYINEFNKLEEGKEIEQIISKNYKNDNPLTVLSPCNYELKTISLLKESNYIKSEDEQNANSDKKNTILQKKRTISTLEDGFEELEYISDESFVLTIKTIFENFSLIEKEKDNFNLQEEENKTKTQKYILKIVANMNSYQYAKYGKNSDKNKNIINNNINPNNNMNNNVQREDLTPEEISELEQLLDNHKNRIIFLQKLSDYRSRGKFYLSEEDYELIAKLFNIIAEKVRRDIDYHSAEMIIILSQTYCIEDGKNKKYLQIGIKENKLFKDKTFWEEFLFYSINKEIMKTLKRDKNTKETKKNSDTKFSNVVFAQILTLIDNMFEFNVDSKVVKEVLEPKINYYKLNDALKHTINDVILSKQKENDMIKEINEKEKEEENKKREEENNKNEVENKTKEEENKTNDINKDIKENEEQKKEENVQKENLGDDGEKKEEDNKNEKEEDKNENI